MDLIWTDGWTIFRLTVGPERAQLWLTWICPMTCQSSESTETIESDRHSDNSSRVVESDESRIASAMKDLRNTGTSETWFITAV